MRHCHNLNKIIWVLLDFFGTLGKCWTQDEVRQLQKVLGHQFRNSQGKTAVDPKLRRLLDVTNVPDHGEFLTTIARELGVTRPITDRTITEFDQLLERVRSMSSMFNDVELVLRKLKRKGYQLGIVSNIWCFDVQHVFFNNGKLHRHFQTPDGKTVMVLSCEVGAAKPEPDFWKRVLELTGAEPEEILVVGDNEDEDIQGALDAGMHAVHVCRLGNPNKEFLDVPRIQHLTELLDLLPDRQVRS